MIRSFFIVFVEAISLIYDWVARGFKKDSRYMKYDYFGVLLSWEKDWTDTTEERSGYDDAVPHDLIFELFNMIGQLIGYALLSLGIEYWTPKQVAVAAPVVDLQCNVCFKKRHVITHIHPEIKPIRVEIPTVKVEVVVPKVNIEFDANCAAIRTRCEAQARDQEKRANRTQRYLNREDSSTGFYF